jgi:hypothetical protein
MLYFSHIEPEHNPFKQTCVPELQLVRLGLKNSFDPIGHVEPLPLHVTSNKHSLLDMQTTFDAS